MRNGKPIWAVLHIVAMLCITVSLLTGLRIAILEHKGLLFFSHFLPQGQMHGPHLVSGFIFASITLTYGFLLYRNSSSNSNGYKSRDKKSQRSAKHIIVPSSRKLIRRYHQVVDRLLYFVSFLSISTGTVLLLDSTVLNKSIILLLHFYAALAFIAYLFLHGGAYIIEKGSSSLKPIFYPLKKLQKSHGKMFIFLSLGMLALGYVFKENFEHNLLIIRINENQDIKIDGKADEALWQSAKSLTINSHGGSNANEGATPMTIRAMHNGYDAFFFIQWQDTTESLQHLPLVKTEDGWKVKENGFYRYDEKQYYEDKFAMILAKQCDLGAAGTVHLGPKPLSDKPKNWSGKGYHYLEDGLVDLWHWKAVRTNKMRLMDDNYISSPDIVRDGHRRYTGGYQTDARESGDYRMNWLWYSPKGVTPKRLPVDANLLTPYQGTLAAEQNWVLPWFSAAPYKEENDSYPIGTIMPSVLYTSNKFEGDRANVHAFATWKDGVWSLEIFRKLTTGSDKDIAIEDGVCMWLAAFDHTQISHTRHNLPIKIRLEP